MWVASASDHSRKQTIVPFLSEEDNSVLQHINGEPFLVSNASLKIFCHHHDWSKLCRVPSANFPSHLVNRIHQYLELSFFVIRHQNKNVYVASCSSLTSGCASDKYNGLNLRGKIGNFFREIFQNPSKPSVFVVEFFSIVVLKQLAQLSCFRICEIKLVVFFLPLSLLFDQSFPHKLAKFGRNRSQTHLRQFSKLSGVVP